MVLMVDRSGLDLILDKEGKKWESFLFLALLESDWDLYLFRGF